MTNIIVSPSKIKQDYFQWLCNIVEIGTENAPYWLLAKDLHSKEFVWYIPNDDNRAMDGEELREEYLYTNHGGKKLRVVNGPCTMLEMLIALARRIGFEVSDPDDDCDFTYKYFWELLGNLGLTMYHDDVYYELSGPEVCNSVLNILVNRDYCSNGEGGLFPLRNRVEDQRQVEIWYQMSAYINERYKF